MNYSAWNIVVMAFERSVETSVSTLLEHKWYQKPLKLNITGWNLWKIYRTARKHINNIQSYTFKTIMKDGLSNYERIYIQKYSKAENGKKEQDYRTNIDLIWLQRETFCWYKKLNFLYAYVLQLLFVRYSWKGCAVHRRKRWFNCNGKVVENFRKKKKNYIKIEELQRSVQ